MFGVGSFWVDDLKLLRNPNGIQDLMKGSKAKDMMSKFIFIPKPKSYHNLDLLGDYYFDVTTFGISS